jgi:Asp-tRNA(Asn)/Glu-tRNA(Gln) amidotransferase A subunit family amidase
VSSSTRNDAVTLARAVRAGEISAVQCCHEALARAADRPAAVWTLDATAALADAAAVDARVARGEDPGRLAGVPVAAKDSFDVAGLPTQLGLAVPVATPERDAAAVGRLRAAGALIIGKTAMDQLAWSMAGQAPGHPALDTPAAPGRITGGSSSGSAAAVAAGIVPLALGGDSAGSVRVPAAWCGVVGLKPTRGLVDLDGCAAMAPSLDTAGVLARSVADCALAMQVLGDVVPTDEPWAPRCAVIDPTGADSEVVSAVRWFVRALTAAGWDIDESDRELGTVKLGRILAAEFAAEWGRTLDPERHRLTDAVHDGLEFGGKVSAVEYLDQLAAMRRATLDAGRVFEKWDLLVLPTVLMAAPPVGDPVSVAIASHFTRAISAYGWPAVSLPLPSPAGGPPIGVQLVAASGADVQLLQWAQAAARALATAPSRP